MRRARLGAIGGLSFALAFGTAALGHVRAQSIPNSSSNAGAPVNALRTVQTAASSLQSFPAHCSPIFDPGASWADDERAIECVAAYSQHVCANRSASGALRESLQIVNRWLWSESSIAQTSDIAWINLQNCVVRSAAVPDSEVVASTNAKLSAWSSNGSYGLIAMCSSICALSSDQRQHAVALAGDRGWTDRVERGISRTSRCIERDMSNHDIDDFEWCVVLISAIETMLHENRARFGNSFQDLAERVAAAHGAASRRVDDVRMVFDVRVNEADRSRRSAEHARLERNLTELAAELDQIMNRAAVQRSAAGHLAGARYDAAVNAADELDRYLRVQLNNDIARAIRTRAQAFPSDFDDISRAFQTLHERATSAWNSFNEEVESFRELRDAVREICGDIAQIGELNRILQGRLTQTERSIALASRQRLESKLVADQNRVEGYGYRFQRRADCRAH